jgi:Tfp pilus assembly protein PilV
LQSIPNENESRGVTFIQILVAVAILGISLVTIIGLEIKTIRLQQVSNRTTVATLLAQEELTEKLQEIRAEKSPSLYSDEGEFEEDYSDYHWEYTLTSTPAEDLYRIDLMVYWDSEDKEASSVTLTSFVFTGGP